MDNEILPMLRSISDTTDSTPQVAMHEGVGKSSEYSDNLAIPNMQVAKLQDVRKDISALTGIVKQFVEYNINRGKSLVSSFTMRNLQILNLLLQPRVNERGLKK